MRTSDTDILTRAAAIARGLAVDAVHAAQSAHRAPAAPRRPRRIGTLAHA
jgi:phosphoribosylcarboxyaminoimidazole (NCAIR) mutase